MIYGYARISTDGQSVAAQVAAFRKHGAGKVFREVASGAKTDRAAPQLRRMIEQLDAGDVLMVTRLEKREAIRRRDRDGEPVREIARSYNVSHSTISRLTA